MQNSTRFVNLGLWIFLAMTFIACSEKPENKYDSQRPVTMSEKKPVILFLGDSLTAGYGLAQQESYPALLQKKFDEQKIPLQAINGGRSGDTTAGGLERLDWYLKSNMQLKHVVISLGSNDAMRAVPLKDTETNLKKIIAKIKNNSQAKIYLIQLETFPNLGSRYGDEFSEVFKKVAKSENVVLLPFFLNNVASIDNLNQADGIHPNAEGTQIVANNLYNSLHKYLIEN
ncbi:MAG: arylesterase [Leptospiraceae bacterium]|nr:arylesterase [Leptospiraceae bacterium]